MTNATPVKKLFWINGNSNDFGWYIAQDGSVVLERGEGENYWSYTLAAGTILCFNDRKVDPVVDTTSDKNQNPIAMDDMADANGGTIKIDVLGNDKDPDGNTIYVNEIKTEAQKGTVEIIDNGRFVKYTPNAGATGMDTFEYFVADGRGGYDVGMVTVKLGGAEPGPGPGPRPEPGPGPGPKPNPLNTVLAGDDTASTDAGKAVVINVGANDQDPQGDDFSITDYDRTSKEGGTVALGADGQITYTPKAGFSGTDTFQYEVTDAKGAKDTATVTITVAAAPQPVNTVDAVNDSATAEAGKSTSINVLVNDKDDQGDTFSLISFTQGTKGTVARDAAGNLIYTANAGATGTDSFTYTIIDDKGATDTATVSVTIKDAPVVNTTDAVDDHASTDAGKSVSINVLSNDVDAQKDGQFVIGFTNGTKGGTVTQSANGQLTYVPAADFSGTDTFTYTIIDSKGATDTATVTVNVAAKPNTAPVANDDTKSTDFGKAVTIDALSNDTDPENDALSITSFTQPANGTVTKNADGSFTYTPKPGFTGHDSYTYTITDGKGGSDAATVVINVGDKPNSAPVAVGDNASVACGQNGVVVNVLANDSDADGDALSVTSVTQGANGTVKINPDGSVAYQPKAGFHGADYFSYTVSDGNGGTATATVKVSVDEPQNINAKLVGATSIDEGTSGSYKVQLDQAVTEDTVFTIQVTDGSAQRVDRNDGAANNQDFAWGGYVNYFKDGHEIRLDNKVWNGQRVSDGNRDAVGPDGTDSWDYTVLNEAGAVQTGGTVQVLVRAGQTVSEPFTVKAFKEKVLIDNDGFGGVGAHEGTETFKVAITNVDGGDSDCITTSSLNGQIVDKTCYVSVSPVAIDMNGDGSINVTGITTSFNKDANAQVGKTVSFDLDGDGAAEQIEWIDGSGDGLLVDMAKVGADGSINGKALFGDEAGTYNNGYEKLAKLDANDDGMVSGTEMANLGVWVDDGDAILESGEMKSASEFGVQSVSTDMDIVMGNDGLELMQSSATMEDGSKLLTEDVWFANENGGDQAQADHDAAMLQHQVHDVNCQ